MLAHAWEQMGEPARNKGPLPREWLWTYKGPAERRLEDDRPSPEGEKGRG